MSGLTPLHIDNPYFRLRTETQRNTPETVAGGNEKMSFAKPPVAVVQAVECADDKVGRGDLSVVDVAGYLDVYRQVPVDVDFRRAVVKQQHRQIGVFTVKQLRRTRTE